MTLPSVTLVGTVTDPGGNAVTGTISFTSTAVMRDLTGNVLYPVVKVTAQVTAGALSVALIASDAGSDVVPYQVLEHFGARRSWVQNFTQAMGPTILYASLGPLGSPPSPTDNYLTASQVEALISETTSIDGGSL